MLVCLQKAAEIQRMASSSSQGLAHRVGSYDSEFEYDSEAERKRRKYADLVKKDKGKRKSKGHKRELEDEYDKEEGRTMRHKIISMNAYDRHKMLINNYMMYYGGKKEDLKSSIIYQYDRHKMLINNYMMYYGGKKEDLKSSIMTKFKTDMDVIRENHKFLWTEDDEDEDSWAKRLAKKYYDKLFKEYCISDLSRYKENKIAMRWRIEREVEEGKGQFICGNRKCNETEGLKSWEVNFAYMEDGQKKNALVKLRLCPDCSYKLNYHHRKKEVKPKKHKDKQTDSKKQRAHESDISPDTPEREPDRNPENQRTSPESEEQGTSQQEVENIWSGPAKIVEEKSREEEFDEYFEDMFL